MGNNKTAFLIVRVEEAFKKKILKKAKDTGKSISDFLREQLDKIV